MPLTKQLAVIAKIVQSEKTAKYSWSLTIFQKYFGNIFLERNEGNKLLEPPDPYLAYLKVKEMIEQNKRPALLIAEFLQSGSTIANSMGNYLIEYNEAVKMMTSPKGRKWLHFWLEDTLDYWQKIAEQATK